MINLWKFISPHISPSHIHRVNPGSRGTNEPSESSISPLKAEGSSCFALSGDIKLSDGSLVPRLPGFTRWMWDGEICGEINFRWNVGTTDLPPHCLGHIGYEVFSWKRNKGYASEALRQILPEAIKLGMPFVELTTDVDNLISQKVIKNNGGILHEKFVKPAAHGGTDGLRFRIYL